MMNVSDREHVARAVLKLLTLGLTVYDCAVLFRAHPRAIRALLA